MKHNCFLSAVIPITNFISRAVLERLIIDLSVEITKHFSDYEIIIVDNHTNTDFTNLSLPDEARSNCYTIELVAPVVWDVVVLAGLERANGDFVLTFDPVYDARSALIDNLYRLAQSGNDITYLRASEAAAWNFRRYIFYKLLRALGSLHVDPHAVGIYLISRRAVNTIVANWSASSFLGGAVFSAGYSPAPIEISDTPQHLRRTGRQNYKVAWAALIRSAGLPLVIGQVAILAMAAVSALSTFNALLVRIGGINIIGQPEAYVPGWSFVVILMSFGFLVTNVAIYAVLRFMYVLLDEGNKAPFYTVQKFGRLS